jgi:hypothetical protein
VVAPDMVTTGHNSHLGPDKLRLEARRTDGDGHRRHTVSGLVNEVGQSVFDHVRATVRDSLLRAHEQDWCGRSTRRRVFRFVGPAAAVAAVHRVLHDSADQIAGELRIPSREAAPGSGRCTASSG